jgi:acyl carrier protein
MVRNIVDELGLLEENGALAQLDSLTMLDLVVALEDAAKVKIPPHELRAESFVSVDAIVALLGRI